ncbi:hypothetical protein [Neoaquamicrobium sediminum]|uniref:hypothetical protein n=1 Tax=Neoaquamicrobium sediminum TaxID=1849104 RepID=UPI0019D60B2A|nr:hypothetical protein [Mesorhizobium sediminum]
MIYDAKNKPDKETGIVFPRDENRKAAVEAGIAAHCIERSSAKSAISHNKFIIRFEGDTPDAVLTGVRISRPAGSLASPMSVMPFSGTRI